MSASFDSSRSSRPSASARRHRTKLSGAQTVSRFPSFPLLYSILRGNKVSVLDISLLRQRVSSSLWKICNLACHLVPSVPGTLVTIMARLLHCFLSFITFLVPSASFHLLHVSRPSIFSLGSGVYACNRSLFCITAKVFKDNCGGCSLFCCCLVKAAEELSGLDS